MNARSTKTESKLDQLQNLLKQHSELSDEKINQIELTGDRFKWEIPLCASSSTDLFLVDLHEGKVSRLDEGESLVDLTEVVVGKYCVMIRTNGSTSAVAYRIKEG